MKYRTDLALESLELYESGQENKRRMLEGAEYAKPFAEGKNSEAEVAHRIPGATCITEQYDNDIKITRIEILDEQGEKIFAKKRGNYITLEIDGIIDGKEGIKDRAAKALAFELKKLIPFHYNLKVLAIGLGNDKVTPDALGPYAVSKMKITRHLFLLYDCDGDSEMANVSGLIPGVMGSTGIETADLIKRTAELVEPEVLLIIDSLAARDIKRVNTTIQINDTGINPGSGMGNVRREISEETIGKRVVAIGVPTVIDAETLVIDALSGFQEAEEEIEEYLRQNPQELVVTSTDIDLVIQDFSDIISNGVNIALHPGIYS